MSSRPRADQEWRQHYAASPGKIATHALLESVDPDFVRPDGAQCQLGAVIDALPSVGVNSFLETEHGKPFSKGGFGNWFRERCDEAGLKHCAAHGLRKAIARRLAENGATQKMIKSVGGWSNDREVAIYTAGADQAELAKTALTELAEWELRTRPNHNQS